MNVEWMGEPIVGRNAEFTLNGSYVDLFQKYAGREVGERTLTITLRTGQHWTRWNRRAYTRGTSVRFYVNDAIFVGRVKFRRMEKMVCVGRFLAMSAVGSAVSDAESGGDERIRTAE